MVTPMQEGNRQLATSPSTRGQQAASSNTQELPLGHEVANASPVNDSRLQPLYSNLKFEFDAVNQVLYAVLHHAPAKQAFGELEIRSYLAKKGYDHYLPTDDDPANLMLRIEHAEEGRFEVCRKLDATVKIEVSADHMTAWVSTTPAYGGAVLSEDAVQTALQAAGVHERFYAGTVIADLLAAPPVTRQVLARGEACVDGTHARLVFLVQEEVSKNLVEDAHGHTDFHELTNFIIVEAGTPLLRKVPASPGKDGFDVLGNSLVAKPGKELGFSSKHSGSMISPDDENLLVAAIKGHPILAQASVKVDPVLHLQNVDIKTGNINFDGAVSIAGDVTVGMHINASGLVHVLGAVEKAGITGDSGITVAGGIIGTDTRMLTAGTLTAKFITMSEAECGQALVVAEYILNSTLHSKGQVLLGNKGGHGCLIGGHCHADKGIIANILGNETYHKTHVAVGYTKKMAEELVELSAKKQQQESLLPKLAEARGMLERAAATEGFTDSICEKLSKLESTIQQITDELHLSTSRHDELANAIEEAAGVMVIVRKMTYPNVWLCINGIELHITTEMGAGRFYVENNTIRFAK